MTEEERERRKSEGGLGARFRRSLGLGSSSSTPVVQEKREGG